MDLEKFEQFEKQYKTFNGFLSADPDIRYFEKGCKCTFALPLKNENETIWLNCEAWNNIAEMIAGTYKKCDEIVVMGYFKESEYNGKQYVNFVVKMAM